MIRLFVILAFFVSGASSLMLEVVWSKGLGQVLGNTLEAITTVVAAYMGGLAIGASWAGRRNAGESNPVRSYGLLEVGIGLFGLVSPYLIKAIGVPLGAAYTALGATSPVYGLVRFLGTFVLLLVPTTLMGATLPILVQWGSRRVDLARVLGTLYAVNTAGAVVGTVLAGFVLLPAVGLSTTATLAGGTSLLLGLVMVLVSRTLGPTPAAPEAAPAPKAATKAVVEKAGDPRLILVLFALSGAVSLSTQIAWSRVAGILLGSSVYSFSLVLATFLVGIAAGAALIVPWISSRGPSWRLFAVLQWVAAFGILYASIRIADAPWDMLSRVVANRGNVRSLWIQESLILASFMLPACLAFGAIFPIATRLSAFPGDTSAHTTGRAYGWNTLGTILGTLVTGFLMVHVLGTRGTLLGVAGAALGIGLVAWFAAPRTTRRKSAIPEGVPIAPFAVPALVLAGFAVLFAFAPEWNRGLLALGVFRPLVATEAEHATTPAEARVAMRDRLSREEMLMFTEGRQGTVTVHRTRMQPYIYSIRFNGKTDASTGLDMRTQILAGQLPAMWSPDSARIAIVGYGSGVTVGSAMTHPFRSADVVEIEPAVYRADQYFREFNHGALSDPRLTAHVDDGRMFLAHAAKPYDVIMSEPSNPWLAGVNNLFTVDFYRLARQHLTPHGVFCQWIQFYEMSDVTVSSLLRSLHEVFPEAQVFLCGRDLLFVATRDGRPLDLKRVAERMTRPQVAADLARADIKTPADLVAYHQGALADIVKRLPPAPFNRDDRPFVEYRAPIDLYVVEPALSPFSEQLLRDDDPVTDLGRWTTGMPPRELAVGVASSLLQSQNLVRANRWIDALRAQDSTATGELYRQLRASVEKADVDAQIASARQALKANDLLLSRRILEQVLARDPGNPTALIQRARVSMRGDSLVAARALLTRAMKAAEGDDLYQAALNLGILEMREGRTAEGLALFERASTIRPREADAWLYQSRVLSQTGRVREAELRLDQARRAGVTPEELEASIQQLRSMETTQ